MKKIQLLVCLFFLFKHIAIAQNNELVWQDSPFSQASKVVYHSTDSSWIIAGTHHLKPNNSNLYRSYSYLLKLDANKNIVWKDSTIGGSEVSRITDLVISYTGDILLSIDMSGCDVANGADSTYIYNQNGGLISQHSYSTEGETSIIPISFSQRILIAHKTIQRISNAGNLVWTFTISSPTVYGERILAQVLNNSTVLVLYNQEYWILDLNSGQQLGYGANAQQYQAVDYSNSTVYWAKSDQSISLLDNNLQVLNTGSFASELDKVHKIQVSTINQIYLLGRKNDRTKLCLMDSTLTIQKVITLDTAHHLFNDFTIGNQEFMLIGGEFGQEVYEAGSELELLRISDGTIHSFYKIYDLSLQGNDSDLDVGVVSIDLDSATSLEIGCMNPLYTHFFTNVNVTIKNHGIIPVQAMDVYLTALSGCGVCPKPIVYKKSLQGLNLLPNDTVQVYFGSITISGQTPTTDYDLCFWTSNTDNKLDINATNNKHCESLTTLKVSTNEVSVSPLNVFPNPANQYITIELPDELELNQVHIINHVGQLVKQIPTFKYATRVRVEHLVNGLYWIEGQTSEGRRFVQKFIVAH